MAGTRGLQLWAEDEVGVFLTLRTRSAGGHGVAGSTALYLGLTPEFPGSGPRGHAA